MSLNFLAFGRALTKPQTAPDSVFRKWVADLLKIVITEEAKSSHAAIDPQNMIARRINPEFHIYSEDAHVLVDAFSRERVARDRSATERINHGAQVWSL